MAFRSLLVVLSSSRPEDWLEILAFIESFYLSGVIPQLLLQKHLNCENTSNVMKWSGCDKYLPLKKVFGT